LGQNKTGTRSIVSLLSGCGYRCAHWESGRVAATICANIDNGVPALTGLDQWDAFTDMDPSRKIQALISRRETTFELTAGWYQFESLFADYPDAFFILNTRNHERWLKSLTRHFKRRGKSDPSFMVEDYIAIRTSAKEQHENSVRIFYEKNPNANFLEVDIEEPDAGKKIISFLNENPSNEANWTHKGRSSTFRFRQMKKKFIKFRRKLHQKMA